MSTHVERVVALGDSLMLGIGTPKQHGWVQMLHSHYNDLNSRSGATRYPRIFYELGTFASNAALLAASVDVETADRFRLPQETDDYDPSKRLAVVSIGVNDSWLQARNGEHVTPMNDFRTSISRIAATLATRSQVLYVGLLPPSEELCSTFWDTVTPPQLESRVAYEEAAAELFEEQGA